MPPERYLAPLGVLGLHVLLLANVVGHRTHLLHFGSLEIAEWIVVVVAILAYLRTVCVDPGVLVKSSEVQSLPRLPAIGIACCLCCCMGQPRQSSREVRRVDPELQPIGWAMEEEMEDPGEEVISLAELGSSNSLEAESHVDRSPGPETTTRSPEARRFQEKRSKEKPETVQGPRLRWCKVCEMYQPLRTKHCRDCGRCIRTHDHHCPWVGTCVGEGNRVYFFWFLVAQWLELVIFLLESCAFFKHHGLQPPLWLAQAPLLVLGTVVQSLLLLMVTCLVCFHSYLALANITTWENMSWYNISYLKSLSPEDGSPFSQSIRMNLALYCCAHFCKGLSQQTEDGWLIWELGEQHNPLDCQSCSSICGDVE